MISHSYCSLNLDLNDSLGVLNFGFGLGFLSSQGIGEELPSRRHSGAGASPHAC
jgi:hypothetical protein